MCRLEFRLFFNLLLLYAKIYVEVLAVGEQRLATKTGVEQAGSVHVTQLQVDEAEKIGKAVDDVPQSAIHGAFQHIFDVRGGSTATLPVRPCARRMVWRGAISCGLVGGGVP